MLEQVKEAFSQYLAAEAMRCVLRASMGRISTPAQEVVSVISSDIASVVTSWKGSDRVWEESQCPCLHPNFEPLQNHYASDCIILFVALRLSAAEVWENFWESPG